MSFNSGSSVCGQKDFGSQCGYLCVGTVGWERRTLLPHFLAFSQVSQSCTFTGSAETRAATQAQEETEFIRLLWLEIVQRGCDDNIIDQEISMVGGGVFDAIHRSESATLSTQDKRSAVGGFCLERNDWKNSNLAEMVSH